MIGFSFGLKAIIDLVRTTITLDDDVFRLAKRYAETRSLTLGKAVSELVRRGFAYQRPTKVASGLHVFDLPPDSPQVTTQRVRELETGEE